MIYMIVTLIVVMIRRIEDNLLFLLFNKGPMFIKKVIILIINLVHITPKGITLELL